MSRLVIGKNAALSTPKNFGGANYMVVGAPGSGKTRYFLEPCLLQMSNTSHIIVDIKGSLYERLAPRLKSNGYNIHRFDFINFDGEKYNPIEFVETEEDAFALASIIIGKCVYAADPYWEQTSTDLLTALIGYAAEFPKRRVAYLYAEEPQLREVKEGDKVSRRLAYYLNCKSKLSLDDVFSLLPDILSTDYPNPLLSRFRECCEGDSTWWPIKRLTPYVGMSEKTLGCIVSTINSAANALRSGAVAEMMGENEFRPEMLGKQKEAVFIQLKDYDSSLHKAAALMISNAVNALIREAGKGKLDVPVQIWMDDCGSYVIPELVNYLSCCRSRGIGFTMLCQSEHQLRAGYGDVEAETIIQCANTYVYMGGQDATSASRIAVRGNIMRSTVLSMPQRSMYIMQQGRRLERAAKLDEESKERLEYQCMRQSSAKNYQRI